MVSQIDASTLDIQDRVVEINRVTKVVKGGRNLRFNAIVVVGDEDGHVGMGTGKALEVPEAIRKAVEDAKNHLIEVPRVDTTIPHQVTGIHGGGKVMMRPAPAGSGVSAGGPIRAVLELAGIEDISSKSLGSDSAINMIKATLDGIQKLKQAEEVAKLRGKSVDELLN